MGPHLIVAILFCVCCYVHSDTISSVETYHTVDDSGPVPVEQDVEVNVAQDVAVFRMAGKESDSDTAVVVDYGESVTGVYDAEAQSCYLAAGVPTEIASASQLKDALDADATQDSETPIEATLFYSVTNDAPVQDASLLPETLKEPCAGLPLLWMQPSGSVGTAVDAETGGEASDDAAEVDLREVAEFAERERRIPPPERWRDGALRPYFPPGLPPSLKGTRDGPRPAVDRPRAALFPKYLSKDDSSLPDRPRPALLPKYLSKDDSSLPNRPRRALLPYYPWMDDSSVPDRLRPAQRPALPSEARQERGIPAQVPYFTSDDRPQAVQLPYRPWLNRHVRSGWNGYAGGQLGPGGSYRVEGGARGNTRGGGQWQVGGYVNGQFGGRPSYGISGTYTFGRGRRSAADPSETGEAVATAVEGEKASETSVEATDGKSAEQSNPGKSGGRAGGRAGSGSVGGTGSERGSRLDRWRAALRNKWAARARGRQGPGPTDVDLAPGCKFVCSYIDKRRVCIEKCE